MQRYLLGLFNTLAPKITDIDWRLDRAHRSLGPKPPSGARPRDVIICFHYYDNKEALTLVTRNKSSIDYKGAKIQIYNDLSPITLVKRRNLRPITSHLQNLRIPYLWSFPFRLIVPCDGTQHCLHDIHEGEAFTKNIGLPPLTEDAMIPPAILPARNPPTTPNRIWTQVQNKQKKSLSTPQRTPHDHSDVLLE